MRVLVCGGRDFSDRKLAFDTLDDLFHHEVVDCIIEGDARGADRIAGAWAKERHIDLRLFPADWQKYGRSAGSIRNKQMLDEGKPDLVIAFPGGHGTANMIKQSKQAGVRVIQITGDYNAKSQN
jgi:YspA, cpYpsA-related SLOG family